MNNNEFSNFLETLKSKCDIVSTVSRYAQLTKKGRKYWACCPFHREKTPSFSVDPDGYYKCFGCGEFGDVIRFVQNYENLTFMEAVSALAKTAGLEVPKWSGDETAAAETKKKKDIYAQITTETAKFYYKQLCAGNQYAKSTREYLSQRGIDSPTIKKFGIGFSPDFQSLPRYLTDKGFKTEDCIGAGVVARSERGNLYDVLGERLIFPIIDIFNTVIGFGGRLLKKGDFAKYKNTSQTLLFDKSKNLYGINLIKKDKQQTRDIVEYIIIVEGYMDAVSLVQAGFTHTVASMGTSLTDEQAEYIARLINRFTNNVYISYDGDAAGQAATIRGLEILKSKGLNVLVLTLPNGLDPDDVIRHHGVEAYKRCIAEALPLTDYRLKCILDKYDLSAVRAEENKRKYLSEALPVIRELSGTEKESYIKLLSRQTGYAPDFLKKESEKRQVSKAEEVESLAASQMQKEAKENTAIRCILASNIFNKHYADDFNLEPYIKQASHAAAYEYICKCRAEKVTPIPAMLFEMMEDNEVDEILSFDFGAEEERLYLDSKNALLGEDGKNRLNELKQQFKTETDLNRKKEIAKEIQIEQQRRRKQ